MEYGDTRQYHYRLRKLARAGTSLVMAVSCRSCCDQPGPCNSCVPSVHTWFKELDAGFPPELQGQTMREVPKENLVR